MGNKGYDGFIVSQPGGGRMPNTVIAGHRHQQEQKLESHVALSNVATSKDPEAKLEILVPFDDKVKRIQYLRTVRDYLNTQLAIVEEQLSREE